MAEECCATNGNVMILTCSGASNVGQLSNRAAVELTQEGFGKMFCLAGIGGHLSGFVQSAKDVPQMVTIDGCSTGCAKAVLEHAEIPIPRNVKITDLGIEKNKDINLKKDDIRKVKETIRSACKQEDSKQCHGASSLGSCC